MLVAENIQIFYMHMLRNRQSIFCTFSSNDQQRGQQQNIYTTNRLCFVVIRVQISMYFLCVRLKRYHLWTYNTQVVQNELFFFPERPITIVIPFVLIHYIRQISIVQLGIKLTKQQLLCIYMQILQQHMMQITQLKFCERLLSPKSP